MILKFSRTLIGCAIGVFVLLNIASNKASAEIAIEQIAEGVYLHYGVHEQIDFKNKGDIANIGFIVGEESVAVIDTGGSKYIGKALKQSVEQVTNLPIRHVILTHGHPDHIFGVKAFESDDAELHIVGHKQLSNALIQRGQYYQQRFIEEAGFAAEDLELLPLTDLVDSDLKINLGNRMLVLTAHKTAHTNNDLTVFDEKTKTIWTGDLLFRERVPVVDGSVAGWHNAMETLSQLQVNLIIPGHGKVASNWQQAFDSQLRYFDKIVFGVRDKILNDEPIQNAVESVGQDEREHWQLFDDHHGQNVSRIYAELEWE